MELMPTTIIVSKIIALHNSLIPVNSKLDEDWDIEAIEAAALTSNLYLHTTHWTNVTE